MAQIAGLHGLIGPMGIDCALVPARPATLVAIRAPAAKRAARRRGLEGMVEVAVRFALDFELRFMVAPWQGSVGVSGASDIGEHLQPKTGHFR